ncbi:uncharacterized protein LOC135480895 [Liolophura sinensis]|uniref:uncharacterized protein LOC135480895 n=1 Tax=Liolophura sinensis TaxID=3198878 RepID=UPI0031589CC2
MADRGADEDNLVGEDEIVTTPEMQIPADPSETDGDQNLTGDNDNNDPQDKCGSEDINEVQNGSDTQIEVREQNGEGTKDDGDNQDGNAKLNDNRGNDYQENGDVVSQEGINNKDSGLNQNGDSSTSLPSPTDEDKKSDDSGKRVLNEALNDIGRTKETVDENRLGELSLTTGQPMDNVDVTEDTQSKEELGISSDPEQKTVFPSIVPDVNKLGNASDGQQIIPAKTVDIASKDPDSTKLPTNKGDIAPALNTSLPLLTPGKPFIGAIPASDVIYSPRDSVTGSRTRVPPKFMRMSTVAMINSSPRPITRESTVSSDTLRRPCRGVTWSEATNSRPPLRIDLEGPTPCTYSPRNKPLGETNAPSYSFGMKCQPEKNGGGRTSWWKAWFQTPHVWLNKVDFLRDRAWPTPSLYENQSPIGSRQASKPSATAFTIPEKKSSKIRFPGVLETPSPSHYSREFADGQTLRRSSSFTHGQRRGGTIPWPVTELTPGPGQYDSTSAPRHACPAFTIQGLRREKSFSLGPFSTF